MFPRVLPSLPTPKHKSALLHPPTTLPHTRTPSALQKTYQGTKGKPHEAEEELEVVLVGVERVEALAQGLGINFAPYQVPNEPALTHNPHRYVKQCERVMECVCV